MSGSIFQAFQLQAAQASFRQGSDPGSAAESAASPVVSAASPVAVTTEVEAAPSENVASEIVEVGDNNDEGDSETEPLGDNYDGIDWPRLPDLQKCAVTLKRGGSWIYRYGYRCQSRKNPSRVFFVCRYCHQHKLIDMGKPGKYDITVATTSAAAHLKKLTRGHGYNKQGKIQPELRGTQESLVQHLMRKGVEISQEAANEMEGFNVQGFRTRAVHWLLENNHPLREFETPAFRELIAFANPLAEANLWKNHQSVTRFVLSQYDSLVPAIRERLATSMSLIHVSFDNWTTKGGKKAFTGIYVHYLSRDGLLEEYPVALPQLAGVHTGERIAEVVHETFEAFEIRSEKVGYFVLDNASNNDTAVGELAYIHNFVARHRRLRCAPHSLNLVGQAMLFGKDKDSLENDDERLEEESFLKDWRTHGPLGTFFDILSHIKTPQQYAKLEEFQRTLAPGVKPKSIEKPVKTRWNSYVRSFRRGVEIQEALSAYIDYHIDLHRTDLVARRARRRNAKEPDAPRWVKNGGLSSNDWQVIVEYIGFLKPLEDATRRLQGRGKSGRWGAIWEVIPTFDSILQLYEDEKNRLDEVDYNVDWAPEAHFKTNINLGWNKLRKYWEKLDDSPAYYAAVLLHPSYKLYCANAWAGKPVWLAKLHSMFESLWANYRNETATNPANPPPPPKRVRIETGIDAIIKKNTAIPGPISNTGDEYKQWAEEKPLDENHPLAKDPISYWMSQRSTYPRLAKMAFDILTIPASSADCERMFSELGDLLEVRRMKMKPQLISAIQCSKAWLKKPWAKQAGKCNTQS
jgi:hypothetical protein